MNIKEFKKKYVNTVGWTQERLDICEDYEKRNPRPDMSAGFWAYQRWYNGLAEFMEEHGY